MTEKTVFPQAIQDAIDTGDSAKVLDAAVSHFGCVAGSVHWLNADNVLELAASKNLPPPVVEMVRLVPIGKGIAGAAAERMEPVSICNLQTDTSGTARPSAKTTGMEGTLAVPMSKDGKLQGVIGIGKVQAYEWPQEEIALLMAVGNALAEKRARS